MKSNAVRHGDVFRIELCPAETSDFRHEIEVGSPVQLVRTSANNDILMRMGDDRVLAVQGSNASQQSYLLRAVASQKAQLIWVCSVSPSKGTPETLSIQVHEFIGPRRVDGMSIGVDDEFVDMNRDRVPEARSTESLIPWLEETFTIDAESGGCRRAIVQGSPRDESEGPRGFRILGARWAVDVKPGAEQRMRAHRLVSVRDVQTAGSRQPPMLLEGEIAFGDATFATVFKAESSLDAIVRDSGSYLGIWQQYQELELESILRRARAIGAIPYEDSRQLDNGNWRLSISRSFLDSGYSIEEFDLGEFELECVAKPPGIFESGASESILEALDEVDVSNGRRPFSGSVVGVESGSIVIRPGDLDANMENTPPPKGSVIPGLRGDLVRLRRRRDAWDRIRGQACPMAHLGHLIENRVVPAPSRRRFEPMSMEARRHFGGEPTPKQALALDVALNTPDIAVIQGPPGTGKTRVLAALQARLGELEEGDDLSGGVLLSGYQHTAVEHAAASASTLGLPPIKIGRRRGQADTADGVDAWARRQVEAVRATLAEIPDPPIRQILRRVRMLTASYQKQLPGRDEDSVVLREVVEQAGDWIKPKLRDELVDSIDRSRRTGSSAGLIADRSGDEAERLVRGLRCEAAAFADDGPRAAYRVLNAVMLKDDIDDMSRAVLERAKDWMEPDPLDFLEDLAAIRDSLIDRLAGVEQHLTVRRVNPEILDLLGRVEQELSIRIEHGEDGPADVLWDFLEGLDGDPRAVRDAMERYTLVLAATCQHAVNPRTVAAKGVSHANEVTFDTVIVDEAARATPLDLLIPMSLAERRIVLVGDHRQLPQLLEPDIERSLSESANEETASVIRQSLFQRLFLHLKSVQAQDGVKRIITLDQQFRMHPVLGDFVSRTFYDEDEQFSSPRPALDFCHGLDDIPEVPALWIDVPGTLGRERGRRGKSRRCEAKTIADWVCRFGEKRSDLSIGVIAFYGDQVREIQREAEIKGIGRIEDGEFLANPEWQKITVGDGAGSQRLRIGTVDSFQGMEFDIVFLSVARSNNHPVKTERDRGRKYGFLTLPNRLNVAMSRQRRLLVVVGDRGFCTGECADASIPGLAEFERLCRSEHGGILDPRGGRIDV